MSAGERGDEQAVVHLDSAGAFLYALLAAVIVVVVVLGGGGLL